MKNLLYYPGFEVQNKNWLKFALLYLDDIKPIIPYMSVPETNYLSNDFRRVMSETDLITPYRPEFEESLYASTLACEEFEKYLSAPERYERYFGHPYSNNLRKKWTNSNSQNETLFEGKYTGEFFDFCIENRIATKCEEGINISKDLAFVFMSFLADIISKNHEYEMITDITKYSNILMKNDINLSKSVSYNLDIAKNNIEFNIPNDINSIPLENFINLRNQRNFSEYRKAYMTEIKKLIVAKEENRPDYSLENLISIKSDIIKICEEVFSMLSSTTLTVFSAITLKNDTSINNMFLASAAAYNEYRTFKKDIYGMSDFINNLKQKHYTRKYVAQIRTINCSYRGR